MAKRLLSMINIKFKKIAKSYKNQEGTLKVINNLSFSLEGNGFYCFFGPSGYGKTTILNLLARLILPDKGEILLKKNENNDKPKISYVFQEDRLLPWCTVAGNIDLVIKEKITDSKKRTQIINYYLELVGLSKKHSDYPHTLSGGEKQRVSIARALSIDPDIILMDEPFSHLDEMVAAKLRSDLLKIHEQSLKTVIFITHNFLEAIYLADKIFILPSIPVKELQEIVVDMPRPRSGDFYEEFIFQKKTQSLIKKIKKFLPNSNTFD